jgi:hypothetical protein
MSADNYLAIVKCKDSKYRAYDLSASCEYPLYKLSEVLLKKHNSVFEVDTMEEAVIKAEEYCNSEIVEYGYRFINILEK